MHHPLNGKVPETKGAAFIAWNAEVVGDVHLGEDSSVWFSVTIRGDIAPIYIGKGSNIQDNAVVHVDTDVPARVGENVTVGHGAILHACDIGDGGLVGMGAIVLSRARIGRECVVGAGALVTEGKEFPDRSLIIGSPARAVRTLTDDDVARMRDNAARYVKRAHEMRKASLETASP